ncbi:hypothetical protein [Reichenbachiella sp. MALMAid0571]|uniref:hypothetical protein n=1 Tax=Reichenbachiella sp. MALMAid0571 TaxID=3143939 RepID=UPI0032DF1041
MKIIALIVLLTIPSIAFCQYKVQSTMTSGKKQITTTQYDDGYVILNTGDRKEGLLQLKIVNNDTTEIRIKFEDKSKAKFSRYDVSEFGLNSMTTDDIREAKNPVKNFHPGYLILESGEKVEGKVACRNVENEINQSFVKTKIMLENSNGEVTIYTPENLKLAFQSIEDMDVIHEKYKTVMVERILTGKFIVMRNPFPTTKNEFASALAESTKDDLNEELVKESFKSGNDLNEIKENYETIDSAEINIFQKEYLVKKSGMEDYLILTKKNYKDWATNAFRDCSDDNSHLRYNNIEEALAYYNQNCGN